MLLQRITNFILITFLHSDRGTSLHTCCNVSVHSWCGIVIQTFLSRTSHSSRQTSLQTDFMVILQFSLTKGSHFCVVTTVGTYLDFRWDIILYIDDVYTYNRVYFTFIRYSCRCNEKKGVAVFCNRYQSNLKQLRIFVSYKVQRIIPLQYIEILMNYNNNNFFV